MPTQTLILTGDINLMNVGPGDNPFVNVRDELRSANLVFSNLECSLYNPPHGQSIEQEGFFADPEIGGAALIDAGIGAVGIANNVNYGEAPIRASIAQLDRLGIPHTGAGVNRKAANAPIIVERDGVRYGFLQRSSVYWATNHEAGDEDTGIAVIMGHTAYHVPMYRDRRGMAPFNRPGIPPRVVTWCDPEYLRTFAEEVAALRSQVDVLVASCHWGLQGEVFDYMTEIAHTAIDAGADIVMGHGPHNPLPVGYYKDKPIFYGLGSFCFHTGHEGIQHGDWVGLMIRAEIEDRKLARTAFQFVRHSAVNETVRCTVDEESKMLLKLSEASLAFGAKFEPDTQFVTVVPVGESGQARAPSTAAFVRRAPPPVPTRGDTPR
ncbi:CapA family protein [Glaciimonas sp. PAMC28666]|uniref:CapA family protein n=1 Tax=Glaciimonas sp. PAMC28666 TaxID=2807626 RepID=UPI001964D98B|nr:CapA family protein [Glaciimonas sp. PAMC28666]QRX81784.1 CapA family protein [Glaciimonas sp. PAMC28666]